MQNNLQNYNVSLWAVIAAGMAILLSCGCASSFQDTYGAYKISSTPDTALPTNKVKLYFLPHYTEVKDGSPEWKIYEELISDSIKFLAEQKDCVATNAGYIGKEALGKSNMFMDILSVFNPAAIARDIRGSELEWQEKAVMNFVNKEFPQGNKEDSLILCLYVRPQYPCKMAGIVIPYPRPGVVSVPSAGISQLEIGYLLVDPAEKTIAKRRKVILTRSVETEIDPQTKDEHWKFDEDQNAFLEKAVTRLLNEFPLMNRRLARRLPAEPSLQALPSVEPLSVANVTQANNDVYVQLAQWCSDQKGCQVTIELVDGPQWVVNIGLKGTSAERLDLNFSSKQTQDDWVNCAVKNGIFRGQGGKADLEQILKTFLSWVDNPDKTHHND